MSDIDFSKNLSLVEKYTPKEEISKHELRNELS